MATASEKPVLFTIGHSNHDWPKFLGLLQQQGVTAVADVRSQPTSRLPQFRRAALEQKLREAGIEYVFLGRELGARRDEPECYEEDCALYERIAALPLFCRGIERILDGTPRHRIALMCAEREPLDCHRTLLVCRQLRNKPVVIQHILADGQVESHAVTEQRLVQLIREPQSLLDSEVTESDWLDRAYLERGRAIAYRRMANHAAAR
ncbi:MAG: DUF488 domain-containing protein [Planctomycetaceae bacterium]